MPAPEAESLPVLDALHSTPARRYLSAEPIPDDVMWAILDAAVRGPSGGNQQGWAWIVVTDPAIKRQVAQWYRAGWSARPLEPAQAAAGRRGRALGPLGKLPLARLNGHGRRGGRRRMGQAASAMPRLAFSKPAGQLLMLGAGDLRAA
jgi:nitroreductase